MMNDIPSKKLDSKRYRALGLVLSIGWIIVIIVYLIVASQNPLKLNPNEFGDFLAGVFGPLGVLWLVLGFWQQGDELRSSVEALNLQSEELRSSVEQQKALVEVTRKKAEAEIQAIKEERESRKIANSPKIILASKGGNAKVVTLEIRNIGANCSNLNIIAVDDDYIESIFNESTLANGELMSFKFNCSNSDYLNFHFAVSYLNRLGEAGYQKIDAARDSVDQVGFRL